jgi:hypothetical protein
VLTIKTGSGRTIVVRNLGAVRRIARVLNGLPVEPAPFCSDGSEVGPPTITFTFRHSVRGTVLAQLSGLDDTTFGSAGCIPYRYTLQGHRRVFVTGGGSLITQAAKVLHRSLR